MAGLMFSQEFDSLMAYHTSNRTQPVETVRHTDGFIFEEYKHLLPEN
jgi:hypothetical protein